MGICWSNDARDRFSRFRHPANVDDKRLMSDRSNGYREFLLQRCQSQPSLGVPVTTSSFGNLPDSLLKRILEKLPFSSLVRVRCVCKQWNALILSSEITPRVFTPKNVLFNFSATELTVRIYSPRDTHWELERKSLAFLLEAQMGDLADALWAPIFTSRWVRLVASGGGLLCFMSSSNFWALIVCNPLTKKWRRLQMPFSNGRHDQLRRENRMPPPPWAVKLWISKNRQLDWQAKLEEEIAICIVVDSESDISTDQGGSYKLVVAGLYEGSERTTLLYQSTTAVWKKIADVPVLKSSNSRFCSRAIASNGHMFCLTGEFQDSYSILRRPTRLLKCDTQKETWSVVELGPELGFASDLVEHCGRILLLTHDRYNIGHSVTFYELQEVENGMAFGPTKLIPSMITSWLNDCQNESIFHFSVRCLGRKHVLYISSKTDKDHKVLVYNASDETCTTAKTPKTSDYVYDAGWQVFSPALHVAV